MRTASSTPSTAPWPTDTRHPPKGPVMSTQNFPLPDVGEGLTEAEIVAWKVAPGDRVAINDVICEIETAKSLV
ncbi:biotin/lipoyl-containing protein, partial [Mycobacterium tuberculosis]